MNKEASKEVVSADDLRIRQLAYELSDAIEAKKGTTRNEKGQVEKSHEQVEYVGLIYRDGDALKATRIHTSNHSSQASIDGALKEAGSAKNVVGVVHNHPDAHVDIVMDRDGVSREKAIAANRLPSAGDWKNAKEAFGQREDVTYFVLDPDGKLRSYDYEDRQKWLTQLEGPKVGPDRGNPSLKPAPELERPPLAPSPGTEPKPDQASLQSQGLYAQAMSKQLPSMQAYPEETRQQMSAYAACVAAERGWNEITGIGMNNATANQRAGDLLCIAGRSNNPDPHANGVAVSPEQATQASPGEWLAKADTMRETLAQTQAQTQQATQSQQQSQSMEESMVHRRVL